MGERRYFGTDGIRGRANTHPMTPEVAPGGMRAMSWPSEFTVKVAGSPPMVMPVAPLVWFAAVVGVAWLSGGLLIAAGVLVWKVRHDSRRRPA